MAAAAKMHYDKSCEELYPTTPDANEILLSRPRICTELTIKIIGDDDDDDEADLWC